MPRSFALLFALATLSASALAQNAYVAEPDSPGTSSTPYAQAEAAPIQRAPSNGRSQNAGAQIKSSQPVQGVLLRTAPDSVVQTLSADANGTEIRVEHGRANVSVHHPAGNTQILVDLPGGQTALVKDGLYTFNADTDTVRVLYGEADAFPAGSDTDIKLKDDHELAFGAQARAREIDSTQANADLLGAPMDGNNHHDGYSVYPGPYAYGWAYPGYPYYGPYWGGYPYWAYGYGPWGYGYPYGFGLGFGYYGGYSGFYRGGFGPRGFGRR